jgi:large subunit ribosomal protein L6
MVPFIKKFDIPKEISVDIQNNVAIFSNFGLKISVDIAKPFEASFFKEGVMIITCPINSLTCRKRDLRFLSPMFGSLKVKINQAISGILSGFSKEIELQGVGYKAELLDSNKLLLKLGYSHDILIDIPNDIKVICPRETRLILKSLSKESLGSFISLLKKCKTPDVYKNKGVLIKGETLIIKKFKKK